MRVSRYNQQGNHCSEVEYKLGLQLIYIFLHAVLADMIFAQIKFS
jgi:hypothetical protein